ncbi:MAG TPA: DoxX family protein [Polyangiaceae bacterium]
MALIVRMPIDVATNASHRSDSFRHRVIVVLLMLSGGIMQVMRRPDAVEGIVRLGYPAYFVVVLGAWKILGSVALLAPKMPLVKEWAYAGFFFDLTGAAISHAVMSSAIGNVIGPLVFAGLAIASWALRPDSRRLEPR